MYLVCFVFSLIIFGLFLIIPFINRHKHINALSIALVGLILSTGILVFPLFKENDFLTRLIMSVFYAIKIPTMSGEFEILSNAPANYFRLYEYTLYLYSVLAPILTASVIISFISNRIDEIRSRIRTSKNVHIFSQINSKTLMLAKNLKKFENIVIFCDQTEDKKLCREVKKINGILLRKNIENIDFSKYLGEIKVYEFNEDEDVNLKRSLKLIDSKRHNNIQFTIYILSSSQMAPIMLDSVSKGQIRTIIVNETEQMTYKILLEKPLYQNANDNKIKVLIVGAGTIGTEFIKNIIWCGQIEDYDLEINIIDLNAKDIEQQFLWQYPELTKENYNINFYQADVNSVSMKKVLDEFCQNTTYVIVALGDDNKNLKCALDLRTYFLKKYNKPLISLVIFNREKQKEIMYLKNEKGVSYNFYSFGSVDDLYGENNILNEEIEKLAQKVHLSYDETDVNLERYYAIEYNKKSSRAAALHLKYQLYSIMGTEDITLRELTDALQREDICYKLACYQHNRWNAYMRSIGYSKATIEDVAKYYQAEGHYIHRIAKLHPAIISFDKLDEVSRKITEITNKKVDFKRSDYDIIEAMPEILQERFISKVNNVFELYSTLGNYYFAKEKYDKAIDYYERAIKMLKENEEADDDANMEIMQENIALARSKMEDRK